MADPQIFYDYLASIRVQFSNYIANASNDFTKKGMNTYGQRIKLAKMNTFTACMHVMNSFDPNSTTHMFTASEMQTWLEKINYLINEQYYVDFSQYYA